MRRSPSPLVAVLGAGPIGLEAALRASASAWPVRVYERGEIGESVRRWGCVRLFSPWRMNASALGRRRLAEFGAEPPDSERDCPTGREFVERYLLPLSRLPELAGAIETGVEVLAVSREGALKSDGIGRGADRAARPFRLLLRAADGVERIECADFVIDATGVFANHNWLGDGGIPALGERALEREIDYGLPDILGADIRDFAGRRTLIVGGGFSAATNAVALDELARAKPQTRATWLYRSADAPIAPIANDPLPERAELTRRANAIAARRDGPVRALPGRTIHAIEKSGATFRLATRDRDDREETIECDRIIANVGYHPDANLHRQLQVHECYATQGPMKLAASLLGQAAGD